MLTVNGRAELVVQITDEAFDGLTRLRASSSAKQLSKTESSGSVVVFHVRHWARKPLTNEELEELTDDQQEDPNNGES